MSGKLCPNGESFIEWPVLTLMISCIVSVEETADNDIVTGMFQVSWCLKKEREQNSRNYLCQFQSFSSRIFQFLTLLLVQCSTSHSAKSQEDR